MSKEKKIVGITTVDKALEQFANESKENREIIEKAKQSKKITPLQALDHIKEQLRQDGFIHLFDMCNVIVVEKSLKALEIIKTKRVDIAHLQDSKDYAEYNEVIGKLATLWRVLPLTEEEYKLLKAIL